MIKNIIIFILLAFIIQDGRVINAYQFAIRKVLWSNDTLVLDYNAERALRLTCEKKLVQM